MTAPTEDTNQPTSISIASSLLRWIDEWAAARGMSRSTAITEITGRYRLITGDPPELSEINRRAIAGFLKGRVASYQTFLDIPFIAQHHIGKRAADQLMKMPLGYLVALVDEAERGR